MKEIKCFADLIGLELKNVTGSVGSEELEFCFSDGNKLRLYHSQDCCESVSVNDIDGDIQDLVGGVVLEFEEAASSDRDANAEVPNEWAESFTWTFYKVATTKGFVNIRWLGESNGYYSESVSASVFTGNENDHDWGIGAGWKSIN